MLSMGRGRGVAPALLVLFLISAVAACGGAATGAAAPGPVGAGVGEQPAAYDPGTPQANGSGDRQALFSAEQRDLLIIKTGALAIQVKGLDEAITKATQQIEALGGYASGSERAGDGDEAQASITFRIPAAAWDQAIAGLRALGEKVLNERSGTEDVTSQVVDLGARIKNLQATESALQGIMARAKEIKDVLAVQAELTQVRGEIEQATAQKTHLEEQAAFSTVTVTFALKPNPVLAETQGFDPASEIDRAVGSLVGVLQALATAGIWFAIVWLPIILALTIVVLVGAWIYRRTRRPGVMDEGPVAPAAESGA